MKAKPNSCDALRLIDNVPVETDDWRLQLHNGDEINIDNGQNEPQPTVIVQSIHYSGAVAQITTQEGEKIECLVSEIF